MSTDSDSDDWFNKDEEELLKDLKIRTHKDEEQGNTEYIRPPISDDEKYLLDQRLTASAKKPTSSVPKISTSGLRKLADGDALEAFLYAFTQESPNFFVGQISLNDSMERVLIYIRVLTMICELKIPGFHKDLIKKFTRNVDLLESLRVIATKMLTRSYKNFWAKDRNKEQIIKIVTDMQKLFEQAWLLAVITPKARETMQHIIRLIEKADTNGLIKIYSAEFTRLQHTLILANKSEGKLKNQIEIYPTLEEFTQDTNASHHFEGFPLLNYEYESVPKYLYKQQEALRADFIMPLLACIQELKQTQKLSQQFASRVLLFENVRIVMNEHFLNARRHEMLFADVNPHKNTKKDEIALMLSALKTGTLLCFSTNFEFANLILAVVTYQDPELSRNGYIAIEVVRQYYIGNIYNKDFVVFSSPAFFEPYNNVYNYLSTCSVEDFAMKEYIVFGKPNVSVPSYLTAENIFAAGTHNFKPTEEAPPSTLPFNKSQHDAVRKALTEEFVLIQGPPGTGKTHISVQLVKILVENRTPKPIIVVAYTNESLDKFLLKLSTYTSSIARFGSQTRLREVCKFNVHDIVQSENIPSRLKRLYFVVNTNFKAVFKQLQQVQKDFDGTDDGYQLVLDAQQKVRSLLEQLNTIRMLFKYYVVRERSIVALTTTCAAKMNFLLRLLQSRIVIFEEAAEILESHVIACLTPLIQHVIMIGDHMQLKPYTSNYVYAQSCDLNVSLFERLIRRNVLKPAILLTQYRMRPIIAELLCPIFYDILYNDDSVERYPKIQGIEENLFFVQHNVEETRSSRDLSLQNKYEANKMIDLATHLLEKGKYSCEDIVILSPYMAQVNLIKSLLPFGLKSVRVMTVDSFQGLEATIILLSLVRNNSEKSIGFLKEKNRVCVALSRAKHGLYIIGGIDLLASCCDTWSSIKNKLKTCNLVGTEFPYMNYHNNENL